MLLFVWLCYTTGRQRSRAMQVRICSLFMPFFIRASCCLDMRQGFRIRAGWKTSLNHICQEQLMSTNSNIFLKVFTFANFLLKISSSWFFWKMATFFFTYPHSLWLSSEPKTLWTWEPEVQFWATPKELKSFSLKFHRVVCAVCVRCINLLNWIVIVCVLIL